jgi:DNA-binding NarL/FixJ family response regulator
VQPIRILLADDHVLVREVTRELLEREPDVEVVAEAGDGEQAVTLAVEMQPDVAVLDAAMPGVNGVEAARRIKAACPETALLILSAFDSDAYLFAALEAGAKGYLLKSSPAQELVRAVRTVHAGGSALHPDMARKDDPWLSASRPEMWPVGEPSCFGFLQPAGQGARRRGGCDLPFRGTG